MDSKEKVSGGSDENHDADFAGIIARSGGVYVVCKKEKGTLWGRTFSRKKRIDIVYRAGTLVG